MWAAGFVFYGGGGEQIIAEEFWRIEGGTLLLVGSQRHSCQLRVA